ncbi:MAG: SMP-30/gluconolactonase/LRE family protein [Spirochaetia bacterium]
MQTTGRAEAEGGRASVTSFEAAFTEMTADYYIKAVGRRRGGGWLTVVRDGLATGDPAAGRSRFLGNPVDGKAHLEMNDGAVGPDGRFYAGSLVQRPGPRVSRGRHVEAGPRRQVRVHPGRTGASQRDLFQPRRPHDVRHRDVGSEDHRLRL